MPRWPRPSCPRPGAGRRVVVLGWSEGGQAAVWAAQMADYTAERAEVLGAAALAPVNTAEQIRIERAMVAAGKKLPSMTGAETAMALYASARTFPELQLSDVFTPSGLSFMTEAARNQCSKHMGQALDYEQAQHGPAVRTEPQNEAAWARRTVEMGLGNPPSKVPVAVFQGDDDPTIFPAASEAYVKQACAVGDGRLLRPLPEDRPRPGAVPGRRRLSGVDRGPVRGQSRPVELQ